MKRPREYFTKRLHRILTMIDGGEIPAVTHVFVCGSYSRGAMECGDLDLAIVHSGPDPATAKRLEREAKKNNKKWNPLHSANRAYCSQIIRKIRRSGEPIDIICADTVKDLMQVFSDVMATGKALWSRRSRNWQAKLKAIKPNRDAGRAPRKEVMSCKRAGCSRFEMEHIVDAVEAHELSVERIPFTTIRPKLNSHYAEWYAEGVSMGWWGKATRDVVPYALWWLQSRRVKRPVWAGPCDLIDESGSYWVRIRGFRPLNAGGFLLQPGAKAFCFVPHRKSDEHDALFVIKPGPSF